MDKKTFIHILKKGSNKLENRNLLVSTCLKTPSLMLVLLNNMSDIDDEGSSFSARIFELACKERLEIILPFLDVFCALLSRIKFDGVVRPCAKICELLQIAYFVKGTPKFKAALSENYLETIVEAAFDWMITDKPVAIQAYSMQTLYLLGTKYYWIHTELAQIIEKQIPFGSTGYKNRGRKVLRAIETNTPLKL